MTSRPAADAPPNPPSSSNPEQQETQDQNGDLQDIKPYVCVSVSAATDYDIIEEKVFLDGENHSLELQVTKPKENLLGQQGSHRIKHRPNQDLRFLK